MNAHLVTIVDAQHWAENWTGAAPFEIEAATTNIAGWPNAPVSVHLMDGTTPQRAAALLQEIVNALLRNGSAWLPRFDDELGTQTEALSATTSGAGLSPAL